MITAVIILHRRDTGELLDSCRYRRKDWRALVERMLFWLRLEVNPHWNYGDLILTCESKSPEVCTAVWAIAITYGWVDSPMEDRWPLFGWQRG